MINYTVISDRDNKERRKLVYNEFDKIGIEEPNFTDAIMATRMNDKEVYAHTIANTFLSKGEVGCALSHKKVYEEFLRTNENSIAIFEDDIKFSDECTLETIEKIMDIVNHMTRPAVVVLQKSIYHADKVYEVTDNLSIYTARNLFCMHGYIINRAGAENILKVQTPIRFEIDAFKFYYWLGSLDLFCLNKALVVQAEELSSNIGDGRYTVHNRTQLKNKAYKELYSKLPFTEKVRAQIKRIKKCFFKHRETLNY